MTTYDFEGGTAGNAATAANTGAMANPVAGGGHAVTLSNLNAISGSNTLQFTAGNTTSALYAEFAAEGGTQNSVYIPIFLSSDGYSVDTTVAQIFAADNTTVVGRLTVRQSDSRLAFTDQGSAHTLVINSNVSAQFGTMVAVRLQLDQSAGTVAARYYTNPIAAVGSYTNDVSASSHTLGTGGFGKLRVGINSTQSSLGANGRTTRFDYLSFTTGLSWISPPAAATAPTANAGADDYDVAGATFQLSGSGTPGTSGGSINGWLWTLLSKSDPALPDPTITTPTAQNTTVTGCGHGVYTFLLRVTQTGGGLQSTATPDTTNTAVIWAHQVSGQPVRPVSITKQVGITREGTATDDITAVMDDDASTGLLWPEPPNGELTTIVWGPCGPAAPDFDIYGWKKAPSGTVTRTITHYREDGTTVLDGPYTGVLGTTEAPIPAGLSPSAVTALGTALSDRRKLVTKIYDVQT